MIMNAATQAHPRAVRWTLFLVAFTAVASLLYTIQNFLGGPLGLTVAVEINDVALSPNGSLIAAAAQDDTIRLWEVIAPRRWASSKQEWPTRKLTGHSAPVVSVDFSPKGAVLYSGGRDGTVRVWRVGDGQTETEAVLNVPGSTPLNDVSLAADGETLATIGDDGVIHIWDVRPAQIAAGARVSQSIDSGGNSKRSVALSPDGYLVAADDGENVQIWDARTGEPVRTLEGYWEDETEQEDWLGHEKEECTKIRVAIGRSRDVDLFQSCQPNTVTALAFSHDGALLASGSADKTIVYWDVDTGQVEAISKGHFSAINRLVFNDSDDGVLSGSADTKAKTWRVTGGKVTGTFVGHLGGVNGVAYGPGQENILTGGDDGTLRLWDTINTSEIRVEWTEKGFQPQWGKMFDAWMLVSGLVGLVCAWGMWQVRRWSHLLALALYIIGPIFVLGPPLLEAFFYDFSLATRLQFAWPLLVLAVWYVVLVYALMRSPVAIFYEAPQDVPLAEQIMASQRMRRARHAVSVGAVWVTLLVILFSVLRQFNLDLAFMKNFLPFILAGAGLTIIVSAASVALAVVLALLGALGRLSNNAIANGVSGFYISLIRGTPLLVQIFIWFLGLPRLGIILSPMVAGILALGINYGAYMTEIFRAGMQAIGKGQHEAAQALGMSRPQTLRRIVLPQAFRIVIPPIGNQFIAMMKDSSLVMIMGVWELTFRANKIGRQYFRSMETFIIAAAFYWILTVIFQFLQGRLEEYMARGERR
jgi:polar amino acid transport system permease protein